MLLALLYIEPNRIGAAAMACDQMSLGNRYWQEVFPGDIPPGSTFETAYVTINNHQLCFKLLNLGVDDQYDGCELAREVEAHISPVRSLERAA